MKANSTKATGRIDMRPILATLNALLCEADRVKRPSAFLQCYRGALLTARDHATWELEQVEGNAEVAP